MTPAELRALPIGTRVVVRYRLHGEAHGATDALGDLTAVDDARCTVATRRGEVVIELRRHRDGEDGAAAARAAPPRRGVSRSARAAG